jgi:hypothetical protein
MGLLSRRKLPAAARPKLVRDERIIAWAPTVDSPRRAVVVTTLGLWLPDRDRLGWHEIHKATWSSPRLTIIPARLVSSRDTYDVMADDAPVAVHLTDPDSVPEEIRKRVTRSVAQTFYEPLPGGGVRVVARRAPGVNGVRWHVRYDEGTDADAPDVVAATEEIVATFAAPEPE